MFAACKKWGIQHCKTRQPADFAPSDYLTLSRNFLQWDRDTKYRDDALDIRLQTAFGWLTQRRAAVPLVIFGHCSCGCDRTGEFFGAYYMRYQGWNLTRALTYDEGVPLRHIVYAYQVAVQWYCGWLFASDPTRYHQLTDCRNCQAFRCAPPPHPPSPVRAGS